MLLYVLLYMGLLYVLLMLIWVLYKVIRYWRKMRSLRKTVKALNKGGTTVIFQRKFSKIIFGKKGYPNFIITTPEKKYEVSVISFLSTHSRWNIEKASDSYFVEARRPSKFFYKTEYRSEPTSDTAADYRRESEFSRSELYLSPTDPAFDKQILLIYPKPNLLTYSERHQDVLYPGNTVCGHEILYLEDFLRLFEKNS